MKTNLIGLGYKQRVGKDLTSKVIQYLTSKKEFPEITWTEFDNYTYFDREGCTWQNKKFADTLKDIVCLLIGCTRKQLEDSEFKEKELGEEWMYYRFIKGYITKNPMITLEKYNTLKDVQKEWLESVRLTPRKLLQLLGTEAGRQIIHPNIWINSLFSKYKLPYERNYTSQEIQEVLDKHRGGITHFQSRLEFSYPNWIISDVRFKNECQAIKDRNGILIKINRDTGIQSTHQSETELDSYTDWNYEINNNGSIEDLIKQVKDILLKEEII